MFSSQLFAGHQERQFRWRHDKPNQALQCILSVFPPWRPQWSPPLHKDQRTHPAPPRAWAGCWKMAPGFSAGRPLPVAGHSAELLLGSPSPLWADLTRVTEWNHQERTGFCPWVSSVRAGNTGFFQDQRRETTCGGCGNPSSRFQKTPYFWKWVTDSTPEGGAKPSHRPIHLRRA